MTSSSGEWGSQGPEDKQEVGVEREQFEADIHSYLTPIPNFSIHMRLRNFVIIPLGFSTTRGHSYLPASGYSLSFPLPPAIWKRL